MSNRYRYLKEFYSKNITMAEVIRDVDDLTPEEKRKLIKLAGEDDIVEVKDDGTLLEKTATEGNKVRARMYKSNEDNKWYGQVMFDANKKSYTYIPAIPFGSWDTVTPGCLTKLGCKYELRKWKRYYNRSYEEFYI